MQPDASPADTRLTREEASWNDVYRASGSEHHKYLWVKRLEQHSYVGESSCVAPAAFARNESSRWAEE